MERGKEEEKREEKRKERKEEVRKEEEWNEEARKEEERVEEERKEEERNEEEWKEEDRAPGTSAAAYPFDDPLVSLPYHYLIAAAPSGLRVWTRMAIDSGRAQIEHGPHRESGPRSSAARYDITGPSPAASTISCHTTAHARMSARRLVLRRPSCDG